jgi:hypothetical protein
MYVFVYVCLLCEGDNVQWRRWCQPCLPKVLDVGRFYQRVFPTKNCNKFFVFVSGMSYHHKFDTLWWCIFFNQEVSFQMIGDTLWECGLWKQQQQQQQQQQCLRWLLSLNWTLLCSVEHRLDEEHFSPLVSSVCAPIIWFLTAYKHTI